MIRPTLFQWLITWLRERRGQTHAGDKHTSASASEDSQPNEWVALRASIQRAEPIERQERYTRPNSHTHYPDRKHSSQRDSPPVEARPTPFGTEVLFSDGATPGSWIIVEEKTVIDWRDLS